MFWFMTRMPSFAAGSTISPDAFDQLFQIHMAATFLIFLLIGGCIVYLFRTNRVPQPKKALWAVVLFMGNMIAMPIFWYLYIRPATWPESEADP
jgi:hypothetical protein